VLNPLERNAEDPAGDIPWSCHILRWSRGAEKDDFAFMAEVFCVIFRVRSLRSPLTMAYPAFIAMGIQREFVHLFSPFSCVKSRGRSTFSHQFHQWGEMFSSKTTLMRRRQTSTRTDGLPHLGGCDSYTRLLDQSLVLLGRSERRCASASGMTKIGSPNALAGLTIDAFPPSFVASGQQIRLRIRLF